MGPRTSEKFGRDSNSSARISSISASVSPFFLLLLWRGEVYRRGVGPAVSLDMIGVPPERLAVAVVQPGDLLFESGGYTRDTRVSDRDAVIDVDLSDAGPAHVLVTRDVEQSLDVAVELLFGTAKELFGGTTASGFRPNSATDATVGTTPESTC